MQTDNQLIRRIKKKQDKKAADELIRRYYRKSMHLLTGRPESGNLRLI